MDQLTELPSDTLKENKEGQDLFESIKKLLEKKHKEVLRDFTKKHRQFVGWLDKNNYQLAQVKSNFIRYLLASGFSTTMLIGAALPGIPPSGTSSTTNSTDQTIVQASPMLKPTPNGNITPPSTSSAKPSDPTLTVAPKIDQKVIPPQGDLFSQVQALVIQYKQWPSEQLEIQVGEAVSQLTHTTATPTLDGHKMNKLVSMMGAEQHLYRYPGDSLAEHAKTEDDKAMFLPSGIAPGLGAWGYFASSKSQFTPHDEQRERYYIAAQTFLFPGFYNDRGFKDWLKFRKVIVYNPSNGKAVVAVIGDAGPATWTGKSSGGSPEVMHHVGLGGGPRKGEVILLFLDDPNDKVPLGPIDTMPSGVL